MADVGLDVGKKQISVFVRHDDKKTTQWTIRASYEEVTKLAKEVLPEGSVCAIEASVSTWTIVRILIRFGHEVKVINPTDAKSISSSMKKTDKLDAKTLCNLLSLSELKTVWVPDEKTLRLRTLCTHLRKITKMKTMYKNEVQAILQRHLLIHPCSDAFGDAGIYWIKEQRKNFTEEENLIVGWNLREIKNLEEREETIAQEMARVCGEDEFIEKALQIEGIASRVALVAKARYGTMDRFGSAKESSAYLGIVPRVQESGEWTGGNRITKRGYAYLRGLLVQGMQAALVSNGPIRRYYLQLRAGNRMNHNKAIMACANKAIRILWTISTRHEDYKGLKESLYNRKIRNYRKLAGLTESTPKAAKTLATKMIKT